MRKEEYGQIAEIINYTTIANLRVTKRELVDELSSLFKSNANFNEKAFRKACGKIKTQKQMKR